MRNSGVRAVLVGNLTDIFSSVQQVLVGSGAQVDWFRGVPDFMDHANAEPQEIGATDLIVAMGNVPIGHLLMDRMPQLRGLVSPVTGIEGFDRLAANERRIVIANGQTLENYESMAEATILLALAAMYDLSGALEALRMGWPDGQRIRGRMLRHRRIGLVGFGAIAQAVARRLIGWDVEIVAYMPRPKPLPSHVQSIDLDELMRSSDIVFVLASLSAESRHIIDERRIGMMKPNALLVNTARGGLVDEAALVRAATSGHIQVALDAFEIEPLPPDAAIRDLPGALLTPHCVGHTVETLAATRRACIDNVMAVLAGNPPPYTVNSEVLPRWIARWQSTRETI